jgi:hypothetical protein
MLLWPDRNVNMEESSAEEVYYENVIFKIETDSKVYMKGC